MKTIKQIADELGVTKQALQKRIAREPLYTSLYPCIHTKNSTKYIDDTGENLIKAAFVKNAPTTISIDVADNQSHQSKSLDTVIEMLKSELEIKNEQIRELNARLAESNAALVAAQQSAQAAQALHAGTIQHHLTDGGEQAEPTAQPAGFFQRIFGKK